MEKRWRNIVRKMGARLLSKEEVESLDSLHFTDTGHGYDIFGMEKEWVLFNYMLGKIFHKYYFRVESHGHENIPGEGRAILAGNHSGVLPLDGAMVIVDVFQNMKPTRQVRAVADFFFANQPLIGTLLSRTGQVIGVRRNFEELLQNEELVMVFPEGTVGIGKPWKERYKLKPFRVGHIELSLRYKAPIIPMAIVGAEEQAPMLYNVKGLADRLGFPYFPITPTFPLFGVVGGLPYPTKYHISYGEPIRFCDEYPPEAVQDPDLIKDLAGQVREVVQEMINEGLRKRKGIFK